MRGTTGRSALCALALCSAVGAVRAADAERGFIDTPVAGNVHLLQGFDCNVVVSAGDDGVVMVDTCVAGTAAKLFESVQKLSAKPIRFVIDTHAHGDHTGGNAFFQQHAPIIAHRATRAIGS
jgi:cyclase